MKNEFIPYEQALELKNLGFDEYCYAKYNRKEFQHNSLGGGINYNDISYGNNLISAPLYQQAFRWFREKYNLFSVIDVDQTMEPLFCYSLSKYKGNFQWDNILPTYSELYYTYEEAELACLKKLIEIVKNK